MKQKKQWKFGNEAKIIECAAVKSLCIAAVTPSIWEKVVTKGKTLMNNETEAASN